MNVDAILKAFNRNQADYILIGGMNFLLNHKPISTFDVDLWVGDNEKNLAAVNSALIELKAEWGPTEKDWKPVPASSAWLQRRAVFCMTSPQGAIDIFRHVKGLEDQFDACRKRARKRKTDLGVPYLSLSDKDMLRCQEALPVGQQNRERMRVLRAHLLKGK